MERPKVKKIQEPSRKHGDSVRRVDMCPGNSRREERENRNKVIRAIKNDGHVRVIYYNSS